MLTWVLGLTNCHAIYHHTFTFHRPLEVEIGGRRQGITKKKLGTPAARLKISKIELFSTFVSLWNALLRIGVDGDGDDGVAAESSNADVKKNLSPPPTSGDVGGGEGALDASSSTIATREDLSGLRYADAKELCRSYREQWHRLRTRVFRVWSEKPSCLLDFTLNSQSSV